MQSFKIQYDGDALKNGEMAVRGLAPALLALDDLITGANQRLSPTAPALSLNFKATKEGSFEVELIAKFTDFVSLFSSKEASAVANLLSFVGLSGYGLFQLLKDSKGKKPKKVVTLSPDEVEIDFGNNEKLKIKKEVLGLYTDPKLREAAYDTIRPLELKGISSFKTFSDGEETNSIGKDELPYFIPPNVEDVEILDYVGEFNLSIISLAFKEDNKWRFTDGGNFYIAIITDKNFLKEIDSDSTSFRKHDVLNVRMRTRQWNTSKGLKTEYEIVEVIKHTKGPKQIDLPFDAEEGDTEDL